MRERSIFLKAQAIEDVNQRRAFLDEVCGENGPLRDRIEGLLRSAASVGDFLDTSGFQAGAAQDTALNLDNVADRPAAPQPNVEATIDGSAVHPPALDLSFLSPSDADDSLGRLGHYEVRKLLGRGGFGMVFRATDSRLDRDVAIKVLMPHFAITSPPRKRFLREARACAAVRHANVVHVYSVEDDPLPAIVMELIEGRTLQDELDQEGPLEISDVLRIAIALAEGLAAAHRSGLVHRDLKPSNVQLEDTGLRRVVLTDFGLARTVDDARLMQTGAVTGTPMYMSPEQAMGKPIDSRTDLFSFGSVLYVMVIGRPPFRGRTSLLVMQRVAEAKPRSIQELVPDCPPSLSRLIETLQAKSPDGRIQTAEQLRDLLIAIAAQPDLIPSEVRPPPMIDQRSTAQTHQQRWADYLKVPIEFTDPRGIPFRLIPPGQFEMGKSPHEASLAFAQGLDPVARQLMYLESARHPVAVTRPYYLAVTEMTQGQYESIMSQNPSRYRLGGFWSEAVIGVDTSALPAETLSAEDASICTAM